MKLIISAIALVSAAAFANEPTATAPAAPAAPAATAPAAPAAKDAKAAHGGKETKEAKVEKADCKKLSGEAKTKCEADAKAKH